MIPYSQLERVPSPAEVAAVVQRLRQWEAEGGAASSPTAAAIKFLAEDVFHDIQIFTGDCGFEVPMDQWKAWPDATCFTATTDLYDEYVQWWTRKYGHVTRWDWGDRKRMNLAEFGRMFSGVWGDVIVPTRRWVDGKQKRGFLCVWHETLSRTVPLKAGRPKYAPETEHET